MSPVCGIFPSWKEILCAEWSLLITLMVFAGLRKTHISTKEKEEKELEEEEKEEKEVWN